jgi:hypothetical protein
VPWNAVYHTSPRARALQGRHYGIDEQQAELGSRKGLAGPTRARGVPTHPMEKVSGSDHDRINRIAFPYALTSPWVSPLSFTVMMAAPSLLLSPRTSLRCSGTLSTTTHGMSSSAALSRKAF